MIIFNTTYHIDDEAHDDFLNYIRQSYIPTAEGSGFVLESRLVRVLSQHQEKGTSYSLQFSFKNNDTMDIWLKTMGNKISADLVDQFGNKVAGFVTLLQEISLND